MKKNIDQIIILGSTLTSLALVRHCRRLRIASIVVDTVRDSACDSRFAEVVLVGGMTDDEILQVVLSKIRAKSSAVIADSDDWLQWIIRNRKDLESERPVILHSSSDVLQTCLDKSMFLRWCAVQNIPSPQLFDVLDGNLDRVKFPVLVRPQITRHRAEDRLPKAVEVKNLSDLEQILNRYKLSGVPVTVAESLLGRNIEQYSVGFVRNERGEARVLVGQKVRPSADWCAGGTFVATKSDKHVAELALSTISALGLFGIGEVEILKDSQSERMYVIEINPRPWVQYALSWRSGFDFLTFLLDPDAYNLDNEILQGKNWIAFGDDLYVAFSRSQGMVTHKNVRVLNYLQSLFHANVYSMWAWGDPGPAFARIRKFWLR